MRRDRLPKKKKSLMLISHSLLALSLSPAALFSCSLDTVERKKQGTAEPKVIEKKRTSSSADAERGSSSGTSSAIVFRQGGEMNYEPRVRSTFNSFFFLPFVRLASTMLQASSSARPAVLLASLSPSSSSPSSRCIPPSARAAPAAARAPFVATARQRARAVVASAADAENEVSTSTSSPIEEPTPAAGAPSVASMDKEVREVIIFAWGVV